MKSGLISIMMPAYNAEGYISQAVECILAKSNPFWELIIVNDGSVDGTGGIIRRYNDPRVKVIFQENAGEAAARNTALENISGEFLAFLDADDFFLPNHFQVTVDYLISHPQLDGVYTDGHYCDQSGATIQTLSSRRRGPFVGDIFDELVRASDVFGPPVCVVLRTRLISQQNLRFDTENGLGTDWDFFIRFSNQARFGYLEQFTCLYRVHQTNLTLLTENDQRKSSQARYRIKAIKNARFNQCALDVRTAVFYDLLINLLVAAPSRQMNIIEYPEFGELPAEEQARLLRLMASKAIMAGVEKHYITTWLARSNALNPGDRRGKILSVLYNLSPLVSKIVLKLKTFNQSIQSQGSPFGKIGS